MLQHAAPLVQRLGYEPSKLETGVRLPDGAIVAVHSGGRRFYHLLRVQRYLLGGGSCDTKFLFAASRPHSHNITDRPSLGKAMLPHVAQQLDDRRREEGVPFPTRCRFRSEGTYFSGRTINTFAPYLLRGRSPCTLRNWKVQWFVPCVGNKRPTPGRPVSSYQTLNCKSV